MLVPLFITFRAFKRKNLDHGGAIGGENYILKFRVFYGVILMSHQHLLQIVKGLFFYILFEIPSMSVLGFV